MSAFQLVFDRFWLILLAVVLLRFSHGFIVRGRASMPDGSPILLDQSFHLG